MKKNHTKQPKWGVLALTLLLVLAAVSGCGKKDAPQADLSLDWDKLAADFQADPSVNQSYLNDVAVSLGDDGYIQITAVLDDSTAPAEALDYADTLLRRLSALAQVQDSSIASGSVDSFGGLYDSYGVQIGIAPQSKTSDSKQWFVFDAIAPGVQTQHELQLQKAYR